MIARLRLLAGALVLLCAGFAHAAPPYIVNCENSPSVVPCSHTGPSNTGNGDQPWDAFGKIQDDLNAIFSNSFTLALPSIFTVSGTPITAGAGAITIGYSGTPLPFANGGTNATSASAALTNLLPSQTGLGGYCLGTNGTVASWIASCGSVLQTNGTNNSTQSTLNLESSGNIQVTNSSGGNVTFQSTQAIDPNNSHVCVSTSTYTVLAADQAALLTLCYTGASQAVALPVGTTTGFGPGWSVDVTNYGPAQAIFTPGSPSTIANGGATLPVAANTSCTLSIDNANNYQVSACTALSAVTAAQSLLCNPGLSSASSSACAMPFQTPEWNGYVNDTQGASVSVTTAGTTTLSVGTAIFASSDVGKTIIISGASGNLLAGANTWTLTAGSGYTNGTYAYVPLTCSSCADSRASQAYATITVSGGVVTAVNISSGSGQKGYYYTVGDVLTAPVAFLGGSGSGFQITLTTTANAPLLTTIAGFTDSEHVTLAASMNSILSNNTCGSTTCTEYIWWGGASGAGGINDAQAAVQTAFTNGASTIHFSKGFYALFGTIVPPSTHGFHIQCDPGATIVAMGPLNAANPANNNIPYNSMIDVQYGPSGSVNGSFASNYGSTIEGCTLEGAFVVQNGIATRSYKTRLFNDVVLDMWGGSSSAPFNSSIGVGSAITIGNHGQGSSIDQVEVNAGAGGMPYWPVTVSQSIGFAHGIKITDTDTMTDHSFVNDYMDTSVEASSAAHITANVSNGSRNLVVTANDHWLHIGDHVSDCANASCSGGPNGSGLIPAGTVIVSGPVNGQALPFVVSTVAAGSASISGTNSFVAGQEIILVAPMTSGGTLVSTTVTGLTVGQIYYASSVGLSSSAFELCAKPSTTCIGSGTGVITPGGTGSWTVVANGMTQGVTGTFVMSQAATGTQTGDSVAVGDPMPLASGGTPAWVADGASAPHIWQVHTFESNGATPLGPGWQMDTSVVHLDSGDQVDNQPAIASGLDIRYGGGTEIAFFCNLGTSYYVAQTCVHIDPGSTTTGPINNPANNYVAAVMQQGFGSSNTAPLAVDGSAGQNNYIQLSTGPTAGPVNATTIAASGLITPTSSIGIKGTSAGDTAQAGSIGEIFSTNCPINNTSTSVTFSVASPTVVNWPSAPWASSGPTNWSCAVNFTGTLPTGISASTTYYVAGASYNSGTGNFNIASTAALAIANTPDINVTVAGTPPYTGIMGAYSNGSTGVVASGAMQVTAGDWDCSAQIEFNVTTTATTTTLYQGGLINGTTFGSDIGKSTIIHVPSGSVSSGTNSSIPAPIFNANTNGNSPVNMLANWNSGAGVINMGGSERCRRMR